MTDAISRSAVLERAEFISWYHVNQNGKMVSGASSSDEAYVKYDDVVHMLKDAPVLDVAPVVHAEWSRDAWNDLRCSHCKERIPYKHCYCEEDDNEWDEEIAQTPWCMYCGARMDGEENATD